MMQIDIEHIAAGGNRHPAAADWVPGVLAFGSDNNIALWNPDDSNNLGVRTLLSGHTGAVNAIKFHRYAGVQRMISGGADRTLRIWEACEEVYRGFQEVQCLHDHAGSINAIAVLDGLDIFVSGSADGVLRVWTIKDSTARLAQVVTLKSQFLPLAIALTTLPGGDTVLAVAGTSSRIYLYVRPYSSDAFELQATLSGHENWIRSLDFTSEHAELDSDILLASASQDKYIRLWRFSKSSEIPSPKTNTDADLAFAVDKTSLSNKCHQIGGAQTQHSVSFEALLIGHEDWIYTTRWGPRPDERKPRTLLSASADNSLSIWGPDPASGLWICRTRLGEVSSQKGSTTATGSTGGFWIGLWHPNGLSVACLGRTGSWRRWTLDVQKDIWDPQVGISGHTQEVQDLAWAPDGSYLLTTASDQTTRLHCQWRRDGKTSWHEFSRPQIHGYDLNCVDVITENQLISGADEKLLRVFDKPRAVGTLLSKLCGTASAKQDDLPDAANIPVLGLSNKAVAALDDDEASGAAEGEGDERETVDPASIIRKNTLDLVRPPLEDHLARHTLWPESEKLYGHGYEISAVATSKDGSLVATACKASSIDHATIRMYETREWREVKPPLTAHSLTVTALAFSPDNMFLLTVGRDRQWAIFKREGERRNVYHLHVANPKGHSRMILGCAWAPASCGHVFATAGRDKSVKLWKLQGHLLDTFECIANLPAAASVTAVDFDPLCVFDRAKLAFADEDGGTTIVILGEGTQIVLEKHVVDPRLTSRKAVNAIQWRPLALNITPETEGMFRPSQLALCSDDISTRIYNIRGINGQA